MTETEKIKKLLNLNNFAAAIVVDEDAYVHGANNFASEKLHSVEVGKNLYSIFDKNTALLVKNNLIDVKAYKKIQRRKVNVLTVESTEKLQLIISPFSINDKTYYYVLIFNENVEENLIAYPTIDDKNIRSKYWQILQQVDKALPQTLIEKKNFQFDLNVEKTPITIWGKDNYLFANDSFLKFTFMSNEEILRKNPAQIFEFSLTEKLNQVEEVLYSIQNMMIIESTEYSIDDIQQINRIVCTPIFDNEENVIATINFGGINPKRSEGKIIKAIDESVEIKTETKTKTENETVVSISSKRKFDNEPDDVKIIYDKNTFKILEVNESAVKLYGYSSEELLKMDITGLCAPEDMQKLLAPIGEANKSIDFKHIKSDGSDVLVEVIQEIVDWNNVEAKLNLIKPKEKKKTKVKEKNKYKKVSQKELPKDDLKPKVKKESTRKKVAKKKDSKNEASEIKNKVASPVAPFLSSLFHELLTPVNVILGFVQEIVDSIDKPTEEQAESAQIIKSNQQLLLQTMNTAVQYSQVNEGIIKQNIEEFNLNNYLIDLKDSVAKISEKENVEVNFEDITDGTTLRNDRKKLLASISYFLKFAISLTSTKKINISFEKDSNQFRVFVNDEDGDISEKLTSEIIEIYRADNNLEKNNFKISPIAIKLARKLNEITAGKINKYNSKNTNAIALTFPILLEDIEVVEEVTETVVAPIDKKEKIVEKVKDEKIEITETKIEEKIIEDIAEEKEIDTEEIATIEKVHVEEKTIVEQETNGLELSKFSCLLIEDSVDSQLLFKSQMKDFELLKMASSLTDALPLVKKYDFDVIYVDINLQGQYNGLDALKIIRQFENYKTTPIIAVTSYPFEGDKENFMLAGFDDYFVKPLLREQLLGSLDQLF